MELFIPQRAWTFLFYLTGDNAVGQAILPVGLPPHTAVAIQQTYPDRLERCVAGQTPVPVVSLTPPADPRTVADFVAWGLETCPSRRVALFVSGPNTPPPAELGRLSALLPAETRLALLAFDGQTSQFIELAYQLNGLADFVVGPQTTPPPVPGNYARLLQAWAAETNPADPRQLARLTVQSIFDTFTGYTKDNPAPLGVSALNLAALTEMIRAFDALTIGMLQSLGDDLVWQIAWDAKNKLALNVGPTPQPGFNVDLKLWLAALSEQLTLAGKQAVAGWYAEALGKLSAPQRAQAEKIIGPAEGRQNDLEPALAANLASLPDWLVDDYHIMQSQRTRAADLAALADRAQTLLNPEQGDLIAACVATQPTLNGLSLFRPRDLDKLAKSSYLALEFNRQVHWAALLGAINLIARHPRALWRLASSLLTTTDSGVRDTLLSRVVGPESVMVGFREQFRALAAPQKLTLSLEPNSEPQSGYRLRLESHQTGATVIEQNSRVNLRTVEDALTGLEALLARPWAGPDELDYLESVGRALGEDIIQNLADYLDAEYSQLAWFTNVSAPHLQLQIPRQLMRYPWELMHDGSGLLCERYALGRQVFMETAQTRPLTVRKNGAIRALIIGDPQFTPEFAAQWPQLPGAREEAEQVALLFEQMARSLGGLLDFERSRDVWIGQSLSKLKLRELLRRGGYDLIHFAGHGAFNPNNPEQSAWLLSDGPLWAQEIRNTLARVESPPWLVFANACEAAMDGGPRYQGDVFGLASAFINQGVAAYIGPLWPVNDAMALQIATDFYRALLPGRLSLGEALRQAKQSARQISAPARGDAPARPPASTRVGLSWAGMVLYGDPAARLTESLWSPHHLAPSRAASVETAPPPVKPSPQAPRRPLQAPVEETLALVSGPDMQALPAEAGRGPETLAAGNKMMALVEVNGLRHWQIIDGENGQAAGLPGSPIPQLARSAETRSSMGLQRGAADYLRIIGRWLISQNDDNLIENLVRHYDREVVPTEQLLRVGSDGSLAPLGTEGWWWLEGNTAAETDKVLLILHGTFSRTAQPAGILRGDFLAWAGRRYRGIIGFDHWTLSKTPEENAKTLWDLLDPRLKRSTGRIDIITHSRGGLVARALVELLKYAKPVNRVIFGCTPNSGTGLANPANWGRAADILANLIHLDETGLYGRLSGLMARLATAEPKTAQLAHLIMRHAPGLWAMNPAATGPRDFLGRLQRGEGPGEGVLYSAVAANYEPLPADTWLKRLLAVPSNTTDAVMDDFFTTFNDLAVDTARVWAVDQPAATEETTVPPWLPGRRMLIFNPNRMMETPEQAAVVNLTGVHHTNILHFQQAQAFLKAQLLG